MTPATPPWWPGPGDPQPGECGYIATEEYRRYLGWMGEERGHRWLRLQQDLSLRTRLTQAALLLLPDDLPRDEYARRRHLIIQTGLLAGPHLGWLDSWLVEMGLAHPTWRAAEKPGIWRRWRGRRELLAAEEPPTRSSSCTRD